MNTSFKFVPHSCVGEVNFNDFRESARKVLGVPYDVFRRSPVSVNSTDHFVSIGLFVYYDKNDLVEAVELARPACLMLNGVDLLAVSCVRLISSVSTLDKNINLERDGFVSNELGLSGYMPDSPQSTECADSLLAFRRGYYDK